METNSSELGTEFVSYGPNTGSPPECVPEFFRRRSYQIFECRGGQPRPTKISRDANTGAGQDFTGLAAAVQLRFRVAVLADGH